MTSGKWRTPRAYFAMRKLNQTGCNYRHGREEPEIMTQSGNIQPEIPSTIRMLVICCEGVKNSDLAWNVDEPSL
ncbi:unnamed protein product [Clavelina lepadiformis]|uniref:Uncharacterized protein n=1 Tax=Clavelina lepadiformis TaxID=159417 RepID=A0ABP0F579_CLALP